jgi:hypothetical protein
MPVSSRVSFFLLTAEFNSTLASWWLLGMGLETFEP